MTSIPEGPKRGDQVVIVNAFGKESSRRALGRVEEAGHDFPIVFVCREEEWLLAEVERREPEGVPWPAEDVRLIEDHF
jgi:hypothetical protein